MFVETHSVFDTKWLCKVWYICWFIKGIQLLLASKRSCPCTHDVKSLWCMVPMCCCLCRVFSDMLPKYLWSGLWLQHVNELCTVNFSYLHLFFLFRKLSDLNAAPNVEEKQYEEVSSEADMPSISSLELLTPEKLDRIAPFFKSASSQVVTKVPFLKRTVAPGPTKRVRGQYFLDLGQADFSHTTCSSCGLVYARGLESDEKLHTSFHRSQLKGIHFKVHISTSCLPCQHFQPNQYLCNMYQLHLCDMWVIVL